MGRAWLRIQGRQLADDFSGPKLRECLSSSVNAHGAVDDRVQRGADFAFSHDAVAGSEVHFGAGDRIMAEGEIGTSLYAIVHGAVRVHRGGQTLAQLGPGEVVGELAALDP